MPDASTPLVELVATRAPTVLSGTFYRHTSPAFEPLSGEGALRAGGRWNVQGDFGAVYLADSPQGAVAEFLRMASLAGLIPDAFLPRLLHSIEVNYVRVLDLTDAAVLSALHVRVDDVLADDRALSQAIAAAARESGLDGVIAPAATGVGVTLAIFDTPDSTARLRVLLTADMDEFL